MPRHFQNHFPQLLVSVRNASEAQAALAGGCDILDVKEPLRGPLGMADPAEIAAVLQAARNSPTQLNVSVALGDARDWPDSASLPQLPVGIEFIKLGTAGMAHSPRWGDDWKGVAERWIPAQQPCPARIIVAYADYQLAESPSPMAVIRESQRLGVCGVLIDTWNKTQPGLFHWLSEHQLAELHELCSAASLSFALAGRLQLNDVPALQRIGPDVLGIRGAACRGQDRAATLDADAVADFKRRLLTPCESGTRPNAPALPSDVSAR